MPTAPEVVAAIDHALRLPGVSSSHWRNRLTGEGIIAPSRGVPREQFPHEIISLILAVCIGYRAAGRPGLALEYGSLVASDGTTLSEQLARFLDRPEDLIELRVMSDEPAAAIRYRQDNGNLADAVFVGPDIDRPSALQRFAVIDGNTWTALVAALRNPPEVPTRKRRRRRRRTT
ncbi:hypothetical protein J8I29_06720 [Labrys sp. LIt4]|uniref:hypothetical protein n=1 Tax=Labrys sp. LIt4 TaxID=2821355 RepID=UPI001ADFD02A|nr:hypothetical protein [Labrys sp. LIt4]MBP0578991.1 hypothetical protein [Labrys sp. LIt4]